MGPIFHPKRCFFNKLLDKLISEEVYAQAKKVWNTFGCNTVGVEHDLYLRTDLPLLADVFQNFRTTCLHQFSLDPARYYNSPGVSSEGLLRKSGFSLSC